MSHTAPGHLALAADQNISERSLKTVSELIDSGLAAPTFVRAVDRADIQHFQNGACDLRGVCDGGHSHVVWHP